ncbi:hypothetical protein [Methanobacterium sp.]|jgi:formate dehydrogenase maturation protein FdhE|uniref:hypothetical protein n=1 Tax=Methanobacterium sp. TaxID=2164 RepID=UPI0031597D9D
MKNKILPLLLVIFMMAIVAISGCIQSDASSINGLSSTINNHLKNGDSYYNTAVTNVNKYSLDNASSNADSALSEFNSAKTSAQKALSYAQNSKDSVFTEYMQNFMGEIDAKINATSQLQQAVTYFKQKDSTNGNSHVTLANSYMDRSIQYETANNNLVKQNPSKFK